MTTCDSRAGHHCTSSVLGPQASLSFGLAGRVYS